MSKRNRYNFISFLFSQWTIKVLLVMIGLTILAYMFISKLHNFEENILASSLVVIIVEIIVYIKNYYKLRVLTGVEYKRITITNKLEIKISDKIYEDITPRYISLNISSKIILNYLGAGKYIGKATYEEGEANIFLAFDQNNPKIAAGTFQYISKKIGSDKPDLGKYEIQIDVLSNEIIYLFYSNSIPSGLTKGYEIWKKA